MKHIGTMLVIGLVLGCSPRVVPVEFIIPNDFAGPFIIKSSPEGEVLKRKHGKIVIHVPKSRVINLKSIHDFPKYYRASARRQNGTPVPFYEPKGDEIALRPCGMRGYNEKDWRLEFFVGTYSEKKDFNFHEFHMSNRSP